MDEALNLGVTLVRVSKICSDLPFFVAGFQHRMVLLMVLLRNFETAGGLLEFARVMELRS